MGTVMKPVLQLGELRLSHFTGVRSLSRAHMIVTSLCLFEPQLYLKIQELVLLQGESIGQSSGWIPGACGVGSLVGT